MNMNVLPPNALLTDLYQLTMLQAYHAERMQETAVFEFFVRHLPPRRNFLVAAGLEPVLEFLENFRLTGPELDWLEATGRFNGEFLRVLGGLRFSGDVHAMLEGTVFFPNEPILRVTAPLPQAQLVETRLVNLLHFQTVIASKAVRCALAAPGKAPVDFGLRRAHGAEAGLLAARACSWRALRPLPTCWPAGGSASRSPARWPTRWCRPATRRKRPSCALRAPIGRTWCS